MISVRGRIGVGTVIAVSVGVGVLWLDRSEPIGHLLRQGQQAWDQRDYKNAEIYAMRALSQDPHSHTALLLAGRAAAQTGRPRIALGYLERVTDDGSSEAVTARCLAGELLLRKLMAPTRAERQFQRGLDQDANSTVANDFLSYLMRLGTRTTEMAAYDLAMVRLGSISPRRLGFLSLNDRLHTDAGFIRDCYAVSPDDPIVLLGMADVHVFEQQYMQAERMLRNVVRTNPELTEAQVRLGQVLLKAGAGQAFVTWHSALPKSVDAHPGIWNVRGGWAGRENEPLVAIRCYAETVLRDPNHQSANYRLGQLLVSLQRADLAAPYLQRSQLLQKYVKAVHANNAKAAIADRDIEQPLTAARLAESLGLIWESYAWFHLASLLDTEHVEAQSGRSRLKKRLPTMPAVRAVAESNPARNFDLTHYPLPRWTVARAPNGHLGSKSLSPSNVTFEDRSVSAGIEFRYFNVSDPHIHGLTRVYEFTGGGAAVLDYDADGWPDIYLTQGCRLEFEDDQPVESGRRDHLDRLFRNLGNGRFDDVTTASGLLENGYSQGATVGDYDNDGFPDLYVGNIGRNRLFHNNGDGTFTDVTATTQTGGNRWTTSCLMADLNGDTLPDIYAVNYLAGPRAFTTVCRDRTGRRHSCLPAQFSAAQDQMYLNRGDGRFEDVTVNSGIEIPDGKGLGIVAGDFDRSGRLSLFIANDGVPNFFFVNQAAGQNHRPKFTERALPLGLSFNRDGLAEACMGIAAGDADGDGRLDLFVTNFAEESNTLYRQGPRRLFIDNTDRAGLRDPSMKWLGFGTQFLDGELDGALDLIVTNGHINVSAHAQMAYEMPPQYFSNAGDGRFVECQSSSIGTYFSGKYLGRAMARLDWNRDGLEDVVISHLDAPAALLTNTTTPTGHFLAVRLRGVRSARDAIGATVTVTVGGKRLMRQLTAGDGYQASNQRMLTFGLGQHTRIDNLEIEWPAGIIQEFHGLSADTELLLIEQRPTPFLYRREP